MQVKVNVLNAFSINNTGGNPAGIVFDADQYSNETKQKIATAAGFPETAFVSSSDTADFKLDFFTPARQIPHCGHATIATFTYLKSQGRIAENHSSKETIDGNRNIEFRNGVAFMEQRAPSFRVIENDVDEILASLGLSAEHIEFGLPLTIVNTGNSFLMIPLTDVRILANLRFNLAEIKRISQKYNLVGFYPYAQSDDISIDATARMFAPSFGIDEEAATGTAAGPLACYLYQYEKVKKTRFAIEQGKYLQPVSRSLLSVDLEIVNGEIKRLFVGGSAYVSGEKIVDVAG